MKDPTLIMQPESVEAILDGRKDQTRRIVSKDNLRTKHGKSARSLKWSNEELQRLGDVNRPAGVLRMWDEGLGAADVDYDELHPKYAKGDLIRIREAHAIVPATAYRMSEDDGHPLPHRVSPEGGHDWCVYKAGWTRCAPHWRSPLLLPKWAERLVLYVHSVRFERLHDIHGMDVVHEGVQLPVPPSGKGALVEVGSKYSASKYLPPPRDAMAGNPWSSDELLRAYFASGWDRLNAKRGYGWATNPWVLVIEFWVHERRDGLA